MAEKLMVTGQMRSGTTLAANFLNSIPKFRVYRDFLHVERVMEAAGVKSIDEKLGRLEGQNAKRKHNSMTKKLPLNEEVFFVDEWKYKSTLEYYMDFLNRMEEGEERVVGHKTTQAWNGLEEVLSSVSDLRAIYVVRDPRDVVVSSARKWPQRRAKWVAESWKEGLEKTLKLKDKFGDRVYVLRFEDLVLNPDEEISHLQGFLEVPMSMPDRLIEYGQVWKSNSSFEETEDLLDTSAVGRWKRRRPWLGKWVERNYGRVMRGTGYGVPEHVPAKTYLHAAIRRIPGGAWESLVYFRRNVRRIVSKMWSLITTKFL